MGVSLAGRSHRRPLFRPENYFRNLREGVARVCHTCVLCVHEEGMTMSAMEANTGARSGFQFARSKGHMSDAYLALTES